MVANNNYLLKSTLSLGIFFLTVFSVGSVPFLPFPPLNFNPAQNSASAALDKNILLNVEIEALIQSPFAALDEALKTAFTTISKYSVQLEEIFQKALSQAGNAPGLDQLVSYLTKIKESLIGGAGANVKLEGGLSIGELQGACDKILGLVQEKKAELEALVKNGLDKIFAVTDVLTDEIQKFTTFMLTNCQSLITNIQSVLYLDITGIGREVSNVLEQIITQISTGKLTDEFKKILEQFKGKSLTFLDGLKAILPTLEKTTQNPAITDLVTNFLENSKLLFSFLPNILQTPFSVSAQASATASVG